MNEKQISDIKFFYELLGGALELFNRNYNARDIYNNEYIEAIYNLCREYNINPENKLSFPDNIFLNENRLDKTFIRIMSR